MRLRLQRHEAVWKFTAYLTWAVEDYIPGGDRKRRAQSNTAVDPIDDPPTPDYGTDGTTVGSSPSLVLNSTSLSHHVAKKPPLVLPLNTINSKFGVNRFAGTLEKFLQSIFKQFTVKIPSPPQVTSEPFVDDVISAKVGDTGSTVLAKPGLSINDSDNAPIRWWDINELCAAQVILIFNLPAQLGEYSTPLAYVRWFRKFSTTRKDQATNMYNVAASTRDGGYANTSIIPITHIVRSCHLIPVFGNQVDDSWTHENVLKKSSKFFLNPYLRHLDFFLLRYVTVDNSHQDQGTTRRR